MSRTWKAWWPREKTSSSTDVYVRRVTATLALSYLRTLAYTPLAGNLPGKGFF